MQLSEHAILIVDDDIEDHQILLSYFEESGLPPDCAYFVTNGKIAIETLNALADEKLPRLIVLDLNMPIMNGQQTLIAIKADVRLKKIPVIIFSTSINSEERRKCLSFGALDYIMKPLSFEEGRKLTEKLLAYAGVTQDS